MLTVYSIYHTVLPVLTFSVKYWYPISSLFPVRWLTRARNDWFTLRTVSANSPDPSAKSLPSSSSIPGAASSPRTPPLKLLRLFWPLLGVAASCLAGDCRGAATVGALELVLLVAVEEELVVTSALLGVADAFGVLVGERP